MKNPLVSPLACAAVAALLCPNTSRAENIRFIQIVKNEVPGTRLHISEVEAFEAGTLPDDLGGGTFGGLSTSTNDIGDGTLTTYGSGNLHPTVGTTSSIQHGAANENPDNILQNAGAVWSTNDAQGTNSQYTLDLGGTFDVTTVRMWPRADTCCTERWRNLEVHLYADDGTGNPGALVATSTDARLTAPGGNVPLELTFLSGSTAIDEIVFNPAFTFPTASDPAVLSSAAPGHVIGTAVALDEFGGPIPSATFSLAAGAGDDNNASYEFDGTAELQLTGDLSGLADGTAQSVLVRATTDEGTFDVPVTFTVILDSDSDNLVDSWELMFGALADFMTGGDADGDGDLDEEEFALGTDPSVSHGAIFLETFAIDDGGFTQEALGNSPIDALYNPGPGTWSIEGDDSGPATNYLTSPAITIPTTGGIQVSFDHRYSIEPDLWDGAALQVSIDGGPFRTVPNSAFVINGYTAMGLIGNHALRGGEGFGGDSPGYGDPAFITSVAEIGGVAAGSTLTLRFLGAFDEGARGAGIPNWEIDSVRVDLLDDSDGDGMSDNFEDNTPGLDPGVNDAAGNLDGDTLTNLEEFLIGTDPNNEDTDGDDLLDSAETDTGMFGDAGDTGSSPLLVDTDGDGRGDGDEVQGSGGFTSDPTKFDTDGDGVDDLTEVERMTDPNDPNDTPMLWTVRNATSSVALNNIQGVRDLFAAGGPIIAETTTQEVTINFRQNAFGPFPDQRPFPVIGSQNDPFTTPMDANDFAILATGNIIIDEAGIYTFGFNSDDGGGIWIDGEPVEVFDANRGSATSLGAIELGLGQHEVEFLYWERGGGAQVQLFVANEIGDQSGLATDNDTIAANFHLLKTSSFPTDDSDGDMIPDAYEESLFPGDLTQLGPGDFDGDTVSDLDEFINGTDPTERDTDGDGLDDNVEDNGGAFVNAGMTGTDPNNPDTDGDGLSDGVEDNGGVYVSENMTGTDPNDPDSDGDGFGDGIEVRTGSDPNDAGSLPPLTLLAYYDFNGHLTDLTGNCPDLGLGGAAALTTAGMGVSGSGGDESLDLVALNDGSFASTVGGDHLDLAFLSNSMSVAFWQYNNGIGSSSAFWIHSPGASNNQRGFQAHTPWGDGIFYFDQAGCCDAPQRLTVPAGAAIENQWQHLVFQRDSAGNREIWIDGVLAASAGGAADLLPFDGIITVGAEGPNKANSFNGRIDDFAIFSDALAPEQIAELAAGTAPIDLVESPTPFAITSITHNPLTGETALQWNSRPNEIYAVWTSGDLILWEEIDDGVASQGETTSYIDTTPVGHPEQYYQIREVE